MSDSDVVLSLEQVTKRFVSGGTPVTALDGVTATIGRGERVALLGVNGAGKTTCMDLVCGVTQPTSGVIRALGMSPRHAVRQGGLTAVLQTGGLLRDLTVQETVRVIAGLHRRPERTGAVLEEAGLTGIAKRLVGRCSGGEQQRLKYALALIPDPQVLVLDEPSSGLDQDGRESLLAHVRQRAGCGTTILHSTHHFEEVEGVADRVLVLRSGRLVADRLLTDLVGPTAPRTIAATLATPEQTTHALRAVQAPGVDDDGSAGRSLRVSAVAHRSDEVARTLLQDFACTDLVVSPPSIDRALALLTMGEA